MEHTHEEYRLQAITNIKETENILSLLKDYMIVDKHDEVNEIYNKMLRTLMNLGSSIIDYLESPYEQTPNKISFGKTFSDENVAQLHKDYDYLVECFNKTHNYVQSTLIADINEGNTIGTLSVDGIMIYSFPRPTLYNKLKEVERMAYDTRRQNFDRQTLSLSQAATEYVDIIRDLKLPLQEIVSICNIEYNGLHCNESDKYTFTSIAEWFTALIREYERVENQFEEFTRLFN